MDKIRPVMVDYKEADIIKASKHVSLDSNWQNIMFLLKHKAESNFILFLELMKKNAVMEPPEFRKKWDLISKEILNDNKTMEGIYFAFLEEAKAGGYVCFDKLKIEGICDERTYDIFAREISKTIKENKKRFNIFFGLTEQCLIEFVEWYDELNAKNRKIKKQLTKKRLYNILMDNFEFYINKWNKQLKDFEQVPYNLTELVVDELLESEHFREAFPAVNRHFTRPFLKELNNKLVLVENGYSKKTQSHVITNVVIERKSPEESVETINTVLSGFCFKDEQDKINAIAYLMTPAVRGLYSRMTVKSPVTMIIGNMPGTGKDTLAGIHSILYEGSKYEEGPFSTSKTNDKGAVDEWRKKFMSLLLRGCSRIHSANNTGNLVNAELEAFTTKEIYSDRVLGGNVYKEIDNEIDVSLSANQGLSYTADLYRRSIIIELFFEGEDVNTRRFKIPEIEDYVSEHRSKILSAIYSLIYNWHEKGKQLNDDCNFASFKQWGMILGSIMTYHNLGNPTIKKMDFYDGGDNETKEMKKLFKYISEHKNNISLKTEDIRAIVGDIQQNKNQEFMSKFSFDTSGDCVKRKDKIEFGKMVNKFLGRVLDNVRLELYNDSTTNKNREYKFVKQTTTNKQNLMD